MPDNTVTRSTGQPGHQPDDPVTLLRIQQRVALDRQAELSIKARALAAEVQIVSAELATVTAQANLYRALLAAVQTAARTTKKEETT